MKSAPRRLPVIMVMAAMIMSAATMTMMPNKITAAAFQSPQSVFASSGRNQVLVGSSASYFNPRSSTISPSQSKMTTTLTKNVGQGRAAAAAAAATTSSLFSSASNENNDGINGSEDGSSNDNNGRRNRIARVVQSIGYRIKQMGRMPIRFQARFRQLSKRAKILFAIQLLCIGAVFGSVSHKAYQNYRYMNDPSTPVNRVPIELPYSTMLDLMESNKSTRPIEGTALHKKLLKSKSAVEDDAFALDKVRVGSDRVLYHITKSSTDPKEDGKIYSFYSQKVDASPELMGTLRNNDIRFTAAPMQRTNLVGTVLRSSIIIFYIMLLVRMYRSMGGNGGAGIGGSKDTPGKLASASPDQPLASFNDIQGIDDAKVEVMELVDTIRHPKKYAILGARAPTGLLLEGPPGTGKTMLARATAAAAGVPLLYCSGSDFVEMYVGRGAARVRNIFERATKMAPCIIFVDELDALGKSRDFGSNNFMGNRGNDEAEQTLNQLLACMDGLDSSRRVCVLAATNRREVLDPALVRPGRFDRIVKLELPNAQGREQILRVHASKLPGFKECKGVDDKRPGSFGKGDRIDLSAIAAVTQGFSGAELEFLVNEAAIRAVRRVTAALQNNNGNNPDVAVHVQPEDFESSLRNFYDTRKPQKNVGDLLKNVWNGQA